ncbi:cytochrome C biogenesis protein [Candidatus Parcubacteria bacterium]|nr:MAG: cytochrome C biogenesis protein [Candidatus Parcubacteria bacterium]
MFGEEITIAVAFVAGLVSFLSPCVLPIIPGFLAYLAGASLSESASKRKDIFVNALLFVLGFSLIFAILGVLLNTALEAVAYDVQTWLARIGGAIIIFFGLYLTGLVRVPFLEREYKFAVNTNFKSKYATSFAFGAAFAAGWTPCVGAVLGSILGLAATQPGSAFSLLFSYSLGLGIPFLLVGLFASQASEFINRYAHVLKYVNIVFGILLIILGVLAFTQNLNRIANLEVLNRYLLGT